MLSLEITFFSLGLERTYRFEIGAIVAEIFSVKVMKYNFLF